jgi:hypothetical protein
MPIFRRGFRYRLLSDPDYAGRMSSSRAHWPIRRYALGSEPGDDLSQTTTPSARLAMMWGLAQEGWALAGRTLPTYDRAHAPTRLYRPGERREDE